MLTLQSNLSPAAIRRTLHRAGFHGVDVQEVEGELRVFGVTADRVDEFGGPALLGEEDRGVVETLLAEADTRRKKVARAHELRQKPVLTQTELTEAVQLLLTIALEE